MTVRGCADCVAGLRRGLSAKPAPGSLAAVCIADRIRSATWDALLWLCLCVYQIGAARERLQRLFRSLLLFRKKRPRKLPALTRMRSLTVLVETLRLID